MKIVKTIKSLQAALADPAVNQIKLGANIHITEPVTIPYGRLIVFGEYKFLGRGYPVRFHGAFDGWRRQVFDEFAPGAIRGAFGSNEVCPEWWGLIPGRNDVAINCAIQTHSPREHGNRVSLAARSYMVSGEINLQASNSTLVGAGRGATKIETTPLWNGFARACPQFGKPQLAVIWFGAKEVYDQSMNTGIADLSIHAYQASLANQEFPVSCIASPSAEEGSFVRNVSMAYFTGAGIIFDGLVNGHRIAPVNGFKLSDYYIVGAMGRDAIPVCLPTHAGNVLIENGTIDCRVTHENTYSWPSIGILARGLGVRIEGAHIEGCGHSIYAEASDSPSSISIRNVNFHWGMEPHMKYYDKDYSTKPPAPIAEQMRAFPDPPNQTDRWYRSTSTGLLIGRAPSEYQSSRAYNMTLSAEHLSNLGPLQYLFRDGLFGGRTPYGLGQYPNSGRATIRSYRRSMGFLPDQPNNTLGTSPEHVRNKTWNGQHGFYELIA